MRTVIFNLIALAAAAICLQPGDAAASSVGDVIPASFSTEFDIYRGDKAIGRHAVTVSHDADKTTVRTEIDMKVKFGPITLFKYTHRATEVWRDGTLVSLESRTDNNGEDMWVDAAMTGTGLQISGSGYKGEAPADIVPSSYWRKSLVDAEAMLNTQTGEILPITVEQMDDNSVTPSGGSAEHYKLSNTLDLNLWYDGDDWVGAQFVIDGEELFYKLADDSFEKVASNEKLLR